MVGALLEVAETKLAEVLVLLENGGSEAAAAGVLHEEVQQPGLDNVGLGKTAAQISVATLNDDASDGLRTVGESGEAEAEVHQKLTHEATLAADVGGVSEEPQQVLLHGVDAVVDGVLNLANAVLIFLEALDVVDVAQVVVVIAMSTHLVEHVLHSERGVLRGSLGGVLLKVGGQLGLLIRVLVRNGGGHGALLEPLRHGAGEVLVEQPQGALIALDGAAETRAAGDGAVYGAADVDERGGGLGQVAAQRAVYGNAGVGHGPDQVLVLGAVLGLQKVLEALRLVQGGVVHLQEAAVEQLNAVHLQVDDHVGHLLEALQKLHVRDADEVPGHAVDQGQHLGREVGEEHVVRVEEVERHGELLPRVPERAEALGVETQSAGAGYHAREDRDLEVRENGLDDEEDGAVAHAHDHGLEVAFEVEVQRLVAPVLHHVGGVQVIDKGDEHLVVVEALVVEVGLSDALQLAANVAEEGDLADDADGDEVVGASPANGAVRLLPRLGRTLDAEVDAPSSLEVLQRADVRVGAAGAVIGLRHRGLAFKPRDVADAVEVIARGRGQGEVHKVDKRRVVHRAQGEPRHQVKALLELAVGRDAAGGPVV
ncbi:class I SAM-dependent methyltransferase [Babesia caballi]|uniref:Class I SAM-dependent methyltransferase n=1 Tax=Babesia caballi TaxID=5871 RepID=A0AAV4M1H2_BABCB|nr:class I SAM-dependent methyltransferase [Babesia caballi]